MKKINESEVEVGERRSPKGDFELDRQHISIALGGKKDIGVWGGGHPFDIEKTVLLPGKKNYPLHSHAAQWEYYLVISGKGLLRGDFEETRLVAGDHVVCPPGEAHQIENDGEEDLVYFVIADHHPADVTSYPNTGKRQLKPEFRFIQATDVDYYEGEE